MTDTTTNDIDQSKEPKSEDNPVDKQTKEHTQNDQIANEILENTSEWDFDFDKKEKLIPKEPCFGKTLFITGLPKIPSKKSEKLKSVIKKKFKAFGTIARGGIDIPIQKDEALSDGICFVNFETEEAVLAAEGEMKFDRSHTLNCVSLLSIMKADEKIKTTAKTLTTLKKAKGLYSHNRDDRQRSQFLTREGSETKVFWNDPIRANMKGRDHFIWFEEENNSDLETLKELDLEDQTPKEEAEEKPKPEEGEETKKETEEESEEESEEEINKKENKNIDKTHILPKAIHSKSNSAWSSTGKFLVSVGDQAEVTIHCGLPLHPISSLRHSPLSHLTFSPRDSFIVTRNKDGQTKVWDSLTAHCKLCLSLPSTRRVKWSFDEAFLAFQNDAGLHVIDARAMRPLPRSPLAIAGLRNYEWAPDKAVLAYRRSPDAEKRVKVAMLEAPSLQPVMSSVYHGGKALKLGWNDGSLALQVRTFTNKNLAKHLFYDFYDYRARGGAKGDRLPVTEKIIGAKKGVQKFPLVLEAVFSPKQRLLAAAYLYEDQHNLAVYSRGGSEEVLHLRREKINAIRWSPCGGRLVAAGLSSSEDQCNGSIVFLDCVTRMVVHRASHFSCNSCAWSPCGSFFMSAILVSLESMKTPSCTYNIYDRNGTILATKSAKSLSQFIWRPRERIASAAEVEAAEKAAPEHSEQFRAVDERVRRLNVSREEREQENLVANYRNALGYIQAALQREADLARQLLVGLYDERLEALVEAEEAVREVLEKVVEKEKGKFALSKGE